MILSQPLIQICPIGTEKTVKSIQALVAFYIDKKSKIGGI